MLDHRYCGWNSQEFMSWSKSRRQRDMHEFLGLQSHHQWHTYSSKAISLNSSKQFHQLSTKYSNMNLWGHFHICHHRFTVPWTLNLLYYSCGMLNSQNTLSGLQEKSPWTKVRNVKRVGMSYSFFFPIKPFLPKVPSRKQRYSCDLREVYQVLAPCGYSGEQFYGESSLALIPRSWRVNPSQ